MRHLLPSLALLAAVACGTGSESPFGASGRDDERSSRPQAVAKDAQPAGPPTEAETGPGSKKGARRLASASNAFGFDLLGQIRHAPGNLVFSPASLTLGLVLPGAGARGETDAAFRKVLHLDESQGSPDKMLPAWGRLLTALEDPAQSARVRIANRLFGEKSETFDPAYLEATRAAFGATLEPADFEEAPEEARSSINAWVEERTEQRIRDLVPKGGISTQTRLVLVNALYFLGQWQKPFEASATRPDPFHARPGESRDVPTMHQTSSLPYIAKDGLQALELPYDGRGYSLLLLLPDVPDGLTALEESLDAARLEGIVAALAPTRVAVALPKFEVNPSSSLPLGAALRTMGLAVAFDPTKADLTGIASSPDPSRRLALEEVFHKAFIRVDEAGTEAAAATATAVTAGSVATPPAPPEAKFEADHPFLFLLRDTTTGLVLFAGRVADPVPPA